MRNVSTIIRNADPRGRRGHGGGERISREGCYRSSATSSDDRSSKGLSIEASGSRWMRCPSSNRSNPSRPHRCLSRPNFQRRVGRRCAPERPRRLVEGVGSRLDPRCGNNASVPPSRLKVPYRRRTAAVAQSRPEVLCGGRSGRLHGPEGYARGGRGPRLVRRAQPVAAGPHEASRDHDGRRGGAQPYRPLTFDQPQLAVHCYLHPAADLVQYAPSLLAMAALVTAQRGLCQKSAGVAMPLRRPPSLRRLLRMAASGFRVVEQLRR